MRCEPPQPYDYASAGDRGSLTWTHAAVVPACTRRRGRQLKAASQCGPAGGVHATMTAAAGIHCHGWCSLKLPSIAEARCSRDTPTCEVLPTRWCSPSGPASSSCQCVNRFEPTNGIMHTLKSLISATHSSCMTNQLTCNQPVGGF